MVLRIAVFQATEHQTGCVVLRLVHLDHLEATLERGVALEIFLALGPGRRGNGAQLAARKHWLEQVRGVGVPRRIARTNQGMGFVNE